MDIRQVEISGANVMVNGNAFLPIFACGTGGVPGCFLDEAAETGINTVQSEYNGDPDYAEHAARLKLYMINTPDDALAGNPRVLYWMLEDEPDTRLPGGPTLRMAEQGGGQPEQDESFLRELASAAYMKLGSQRDACARLGDMRPVFLNFSYLFLPTFWGTEHFNRMLYSRMAETADIISWDIYPLSDWNRKDFLPLIWLGTRTLKTWFPNKPLHIYLECNALHGRGRDASAEEMRNELWQAIIAGATGIGWFYGGVAARDAKSGDFPLNSQHRARMLGVNTELLSMSSLVFTPELAGGAIEDGHGSPEIVVSLRNDNGRIRLLAANAKYNRRPMALEKVEAWKPYVKNEIEGALSSLPALAFDDMAPLEVRLV